MPILPPYNLISSSFSCSIFSIYVITLFSANCLSGLVLELKGFLYFKVCYSYSALKCIGFCLWWSQLRSLWFFIFCLLHGLGSNNKHRVLVYFIFKSRFCWYMDCVIHLHEFACTCWVLEDRDCNRTVELSQELINQSPKSEYIAYQIDTQYLYLFVYLLSSF